MKKLFIVAGFITSLSALGYAASQAQSLGLVRVQISSGTAAQIDSTTPLGAFELIGCTDCIQSPLCISTGTTKGSYVVVSSSHSTGTAASLVPCR